jgi:hypothetical protein
MIVVWRIDPTSVGESSRDSSLSIGILVKYSDQDSPSQSIRIVARGALEDTPLIIVGDIVIDHWTRDQEYRYVPLGTSPLTSLIGNCKSRRAEC